MNWLSAISILLYILSITGNEASAAGRKKIRILVPQKVKHIHHHKKVYITQHMTQPTQFMPQYADSEQYASGYLAATEPATAVASAITLIPLAEGRRSTPAGLPAPNIQPLYRARGHYGPSPTYSATKITEVKPNTKRIKVIKVSEGKRKNKIILKKKPTRIIIRDQSQEEKDVSPTSSYHSEFYSDLKANQNTFKTMKKPKRVEKYVDGDGEHIHTYSEEHIHQVVYDESPQSGQSGGAPTSLVPMDVAVQHAMHSPVIHGSVAPSILPSVYPSVALQATSPSHYYGGMPGMGSMGTSGHLEYMHYDPQDVTHDHMFHDHGEIIHSLIPENKFPGPPKASYTGHGFKVNPTFSTYDVPSYEGKGSWVPQDNDKQKEAPHTLAYYENFYSSKKNKKQKEQKTPYKSSSSASSNKYKYTDEVPINSDAHFEEIFDHLKSQTSKYYGKQSSKGVKSNRRPVSYSTSEPYKKPKISSLRQHHFHKVAENKPYSTVPSFSDSYTLGNHITINNNYKEPKEPSTFKHYTNIYSASSKPGTNDAHTASTTDHNNEKDVISVLNWRGGKKNKNKKSVSTQNISFGGQEHKMVINHETAETRSLTSQIQDSAAQASDLDIIAYPSSDSYYSVMAPKPYKSSSTIPDSSNHNYRIMEAPMMVAAESSSVVEKIKIIKPPSVTTPQPATSSSTIATVEAKTHKTPRKSKKKSNDKKQRAKVVEPIPVLVEAPKTSTKAPTTSNKLSTMGRGRYKFGDRLQDRFDYEYEDFVFV